MEIFLYIILGGIVFLKICPFVWIILEIAFGGPQKSTQSKSAGNSSISSDNRASNRYFLEEQQRTIREAQASACKMTQEAHDAAVRNCEKAHEDACRTAQDAHNAAVFEHQQMNNSASAGFGCGGPFF